MVAQPAAGPNCRGCGHQQPAQRVQGITQTHWAGTSSPNGASAVPIARPAQKLLNVGQHAH
eukprot:6694664-Karenia_brevis.AAC.1